MSEIEAALKNKNRNELVVIAKRAKLKDYSKLNKKELYNKIIYEADNNRLAQELGLKKDSILRRILSSPYFHVMGLVITFGFAVYAYFTTMDREELARSFEKLGEENEKLREESKKGYKILYGQNGGSDEVFDFKFDGYTKILENKYPYGFKLIGILHQDSIYHGRASKNLKTIYDVNWETLKVKIDKEHDSIEIILPINRIKKGDGLIGNISIGDKIPLPQKNQPSAVPIDLDLGVQLYFELLENSGFYPVYLFGFK